MADDKTEQPPEDQQADASARPVRVRKKSGSSGRAGKTAKPASSKKKTAAKPKTTSTRGDAAKRKPAPRKKQQSGSSRSSRQDSSTVKNTASAAEPTDAQSPKNTETAKAASVAVDKPPLQTVADAAPANDGVDQPPAPPEREGSSDWVNQVISLIRGKSGYDLSHYKPSTLDRRIAARMALHDCASLQAYAERLDSDAEEALALVREVLASATAFFRDPDGFDALQSLIEKLVEDKGAHDVLRIWVPACATGEEAYSLAMLFAEAVRERPDAPAFIVFASDIDQAAVEHARNGVYDEAAVQSLPQAYRDRYLDQQGQAYSVCATLRRHLVFAAQNLMDDPPFSRIDLVACRNLLIDFTRAAQARIQDILHYALKPGGILFLGTTETCDRQDLFEPIASAGCIYRRLDNTGPDAGGKAHQPRVRISAASDAAPGASRGDNTPSLAVRMRDALLERYSPPSLLVDANNNVVNFTGDLRPFLRFPSGSAELDLFAMVDEALRPEVRALVNRCRREAVGREGGIRTLKIEGEQARVRVSVAPLEHDEHTFLTLSFNRVTESPESEQSAVGEDLQGGIMAELEKELAATRQQLRTVIEALATSSKERQLQGDALQSSNEEMRFTHEALQTANETIQSSHERLLTANNALEQKSAELARLAEDLDNIKESLDYPMVVLDEHLRVSQANAAAVELLHLDDLAPEAPIASIDADIDLLGFLPNIRGVFLSGVPDEISINDHQGRKFTLRVVPYRSPEQKTVGVLLSFFDVTSQQRSEAAIRESEALYRATFEQGGVGMALLNEKRRITRINTALCSLLGRSEATLGNKAIDELLVDGDRARWLTAVSGMNAKSITTHRDEYRLVNANGDPVRVLLNVAVSRNARGEAERYICQIENVQREKERELSLQQERHRLSLLNKVSRALVGEESSHAVVETTLANMARIFPGTIAMHATLSDDGRISLLEAAAGDGVDMREPSMRSFVLDTGQPLVVRLRGGRPAVASDVNESGLYREARPYFEAEGIRGALVTPMRHEYDEMGLICLFSTQPRAWSEHEISLSTAVADLLEVGLSTARLREERAVAVEALSDERERIQTTLRAVGDGVITTNLDLRITYMNPAAENLIVCRLEDALGKPLEEYFALYSDHGSRSIESPVRRCLTDNRVIEQTEYGVSLTNRGGRRIGIDSSAAPLTNHAGEIVGAVLVFRDVTDQQLLADELSYRASHDLLTGLVNRDEFERILNREMAPGQRSEHASDALLYVDLDRFKIVNDSSGHTAGDELLRQIAGVLRERLRKADLLARLGGDEFGILLRNCDLETAERIAGELINAVETHRFDWDDRSYDVGASIGVAMIDSGAENVSRVLAQADAACYSAKDAGRNRFHVSGSEEEQTSGRYTEMQLVADISDAIQDERFKFVSQPVLDIHQQPLVATYHELLVRFVGVDGQVISPGEFIPAAERYYLMNSVDRATTRRALSQLGPVLDRTDAVYAINLSGQTLSDSKFVGFVRDGLLEYGLNPEQICFEITETAAVSQLTVAVRFMNQLRDMGCKFALDDFGAGMSSFTYLKNMPIDYLKIDGSFVRNILESSVDRAVVESAVRIGNELGIITIAEHLEDEATLDMLRLMNVDLVQGFYTGKPGPFPE
ncbi:MAG: hypothetical protein CMN28_06855 [Salinisphaeraceae bacterium]|nr:hypothetical protein [Salinisphaeraceae bacterium]